MPTYGTSYDETIYDAPTFTGAKALSTPVRTPAPVTNVTPPGSAVPRDPRTYLGYVPGFQGDPTAPLNPNLPPPKPPPTTTTPTGTAFNPKNPKPWIDYLYGQHPDLKSKYGDYTAFWLDEIAKDNGAHDETYWTQRILGNEIYGEGRSTTNTVGRGGSSSGDDGGGFDFSNFDFGALTNLFDDPASAQLMKLISSRIGQLTTPINDPNAALVQQQIIDALNRLTTLQNTPLAPATTTVKDVPDISGSLNEILKRLDLNTGALAGPTQQYRGILDNLVQELSKPAFSDDQLAQLKTAAVDTLNHQHQQATDNTVRSLAMRGVAPSSGLVQEAIKNVDEQYQGLKAQALQAQNVSEINQINQRRQQLMEAAASGLTAAQQEIATTQSGLLGQLNAILSGRSQDIALRGQSLEQLNAELNRQLQQRSQDIGLTTSSVTLAQALEELGRQQRLEQNTNFNTAIQMAGIPVQLSGERLNQALQVLGLGSGTTSTGLLAALNALSQSTGLQNATNQAGRNTDLAGLGAWLADWIKNHPGGI